MEYFSRITANHWTAKNNAEKEAHDLGRKMERFLISENNLQEYLRKFQEIVNIINTNNKRCKPLSLEVWKPNESSDDIFINIRGVFNISLIKVKESLEYLQD